MDIGSYQYYHDVQMKIYPKALVEVVNISVPKPKLIVEVSMEIHFVLVPQMIVSMIACADLFCACKSTPSGECDAMYLAQLSYTCKRKH